MLADMVQRGQVALDDPVAKFPPATVKMPERAVDRAGRFGDAPHANDGPMRATPGQLRPQLLQLRDIATVS